MALEEFYVSEGINLDLTNMDICSSHFPAYRISVVPSSLQNEVWADENGIQNSSRIVPWSSFLTLLVYRLFPNWTYTTLGEVMRWEGQGHWSKLSQSPPFPTLTFNSTNSCPFYLLDKFWGEEPHLPCLPLYISSLPSTLSRSPLSIYWSK